jgi:hypothetical protein
LPKNVYAILEDERIHDVLDGGLSPVISVLLPLSKIRASESSYHSIFVKVMIFEYLTRSLPQFGDGWSVADVWDS